MGIGETMSDYIAYGERVLFAGDFADAARMNAKLEFLCEVNRAKLQSLCLPDNEQIARERAWLDEQDWRDWLTDVYRDIAGRARIVPSTHLHTILQQPGAVVFEGAQGVLLDEWSGFHPHTTWSTTTLANADQLLREAQYNGATTRVGITRAYTTRHGAGPLVTEDAALTTQLPDARNSFGAWQQGFRAGWLDLVLLRYAIETTGTLDHLAVTCVDRLAQLPTLNVCRRYDNNTFGDHIPLAPTPHDLSYQARLTETLLRAQPMLESVPNIEALLALIATELHLPVGLVSQGPTALDKRLC